MDAKEFLTLVAAGLAVPAMISVWGWFWPPLWGWLRDNTWATAAVTAFATSALTIAVAVAMGLTGRQGLTLPVPAGTVIASTEQCDPKLGWREYDQAAGRVLVGVGRGRDKNGLEENFVFGVPASNQDGEYQHKLSIPEMPPHYHKVYPHAGEFIGTKQTGIATVNGAGSADTNQVRDSSTSTVGGGEAFNLLPPFVALHFCRKEG